jgi:hypothetical protein
MLPTSIVNFWTARSTQLDTKFRKMTKKKIFLHTNEKPAHISVRVVVIKFYQLEA